MVEIHSPYINSWRSLCYYMACLFFVIIIIPLLHDGMFFDGVIYAALAKNLSLEADTVWRPVLSQSMLNPFYEHPPLAIYFQSLFFKVLGQGYGVERFYALVMALGQVGLISWYWLKKKQGTSVLSLGLLILCWLMIPINWLYISNYLIATLTLFSTLASLILLKRIQSKFGLFLQYLLCSIIILIAFLCDGPTAFFPLAIPLIYRLVYNPSSIYTGFLETIFFVCILALVFFSFFWACPDALFNIQRYLSQQVLSSIMGTRSQQTLGIKHLYVLYILLKSYAGISVFAILCMIISAKIDQQPILNSIRTRLREKNFLLFFLIAMASSLPIAISCRQGMRYIMPSAPFFTLAMMWICFQPFENIIKYYTQKPLPLKLPRKTIPLFFATFIGIMGITNLVKYYQSDVPKVLKDIRNISNYCVNDTYCSHHAILSISNSTVLWKASFYLARYSPIMMGITHELGFPYYLGLKSDPIPDGYHLVNAPLSVFNLAILDYKTASVKTAVANPIQSF